MRQEVQSDKVFLSKASLTKPDRAGKRLIYVKKLVHVDLVLMETKGVFDGEISRTKLAFLQLIWMRHTEVLSHGIFVVVSSVADGAEKSDLFVLLSQMHLLCFVRNRFFFAKQTSIFGFVLFPDRVGLRNVALEAEKQMYYICII